MWIEFNPNPIGRHVEDCAVRAVSKALNIDWEHAYDLLTDAGYDMCDMPHSNGVISGVLRKNGFYSLEDRLCEELEELGLKEKWDAGDLEIVDRLAHALKNTEKILDHYENNGYSGRMFDEPMYYPYNGRTRGSMYARNGGYSRARRYERSGRYSRDGGYSMADSGMIDEFRDLMMDVQDEGIKKDIKKIIEKLENM